MKATYTNTGIPRTIRPYAVSDITHIVLEYLSADKRTLASCSLVCTDWTFVARLHLFATVRLHGGRAPAFFSFLLSPGAASIKKHIHCLRWMEAEDDGLEISNLCKIVASLPRIETLYLSFNRFKTRPTAFPYDHIKSCLAHVRHLSVRCRLRLNGRQNNVQPLAEFLTMFKVDKMDIDSFKEESEAEPVDPYRVSYFPTPSRPLQARHLTFVNGHAMFQEADILSRTLGPVNHTLHSITYTFHAPADLYALGRLLRNSGRHLSRITLFCDPHGEKETFHTIDWHKLNFTYCEHLEALSLPNFWNHPHHLAALFDVLACDVEGLRNLSLGITNPSCLSLASMTDAQWSKTDNLLASLRDAVTVSVNLGAIAEHEEQKFIIDRIKGRWPSVLRSGRLMFRNTCQYEV